MDVSADSSNVQRDEFELCELFLVIRPEDKQSVCRLLEGEVGAEYISYHVLGRGCEGGFLYGQQEPGKWFGWFDRPMPLAFLPKIMVWTVIERERALELVRYVGSIIRQNGVPTQYAGGFAFVSKLGHEIPVGYSEAKSPAPAKESAYLI